jgi:uncharacterized phage-associated protein
MTTVNDVAAHVLHHFGGSISTMKLQKICFFSQGWSLALRGKTLFDEDFQAWRDGPVCYELFDHHRRQFRVAEWPWGNRKALTEKQRIVVDAALDSFDALTGLQLSELTHRSGSPWSVTRKRSGVGEGQASSLVIPKDLMRNYFAAELGVDRVTSERRPKHAE